MAIHPELAGHYVGEQRIRPGKENSLTPAERKSLVRSGGSFPLDLHSDGTFLYKEATAGTFMVSGDVIQFCPSTFSGQTLAEMRAAAESVGREFGLSWLFNPFELRRVNDGLESPDTQAVIYLRFERA